MDDQPPKWIGKVLYTGSDTHGYHDFCIFKRDGSESHFLRADRSGDMEIELEQLKAVIALYEAGKQ